MNVRRENSNNSPKAGTGSGYLLLCEYFRSLHCGLYIYICNSLSQSGLAGLASVGGVSADVLPAALSAAVCVRLALDERSLLDRTRRHATRGATVHTGCTSSGRC